MLLLDFSPIILSRKNVPIKITHTIYIFKIPVMCARLTCLLAFRKYRDVNKRYKIYCFDF